MGSIQLHERYVTVGGEEYDSGGVHIKIMPRTFRIREYEDSQIELWMFLSFMAGAMIWPIVGFLRWAFL